MQLSSQPMIFRKLERTLLCWYHRNETAFAFDETVRVQSLEPIRETLWNPLLHRTFGGWVTGPGFVATEARTLVSAQPRQSFHIRVASPSEQTATSDDWVMLARDIALAHADPAAAVQRTAEWWTAFQARSWVRCKVPPGRDVPVTRLAALPEGLASPEEQRFFARMRAAAPDIPTEQVVVDGAADRGGTDP